MTERERNYVSIVVSARGTSGGAFYPYRLPSRDDLHTYQAQPAEPCECEYCGTRHLFKPLGCKVCRTRRSDHVAEQRELRRMVQLVERSEQRECPQCQGDAMLRKMEDGEKRLDPYAPCRACNGYGVKLFDRSTGKRVRL